MRDRIGRVAVLAAGALMAGIAAAPAQAAPGWLAPDASDWGGNATSGVQGVMGPDGDAASAFTNGSQAVQAGFRPAGGGAFHIYSKLAGSDTINNGIRVDVGSGGQAVAVHRQTVNDAGDADVNPGTRTAVYAVAHTTAGWGTPVRLSSAFGDTMSQPNPEVDVDEAGPAAVAWVRDGHVWASRRLSGSAAFGMEEDVGPAGGAGTADVAVAPDGTVVVLWNASGALKASRRSPTDPSWSAAKTPTGAGAGSADEQVVMSDAGEATILRRSGSSILASRWLAGAADPTGEATISTSAAADRPTLATAGGAPYVSYVEGTTGRVAVGNAGSFSSAKIDAGAVANPVIAAGAGGRLAVLFEQGGETVAKVATLPALENAELTGLAPVGGALSPGIDSDGNALAVFGAEAVAALYDGAGPRLRNLSVPATGSKGKALTFSVSPFEPITTVASTVWSFGDGTGASGPSVSHAYAKAGTYTVKVTSTDTRGNVSVATRTLVIPAPASAGTPPPPTGGSTRGDTTAPRLASLKGSARSLTLRLSERSRVRVVVERRTKGKWRRVRTVSRSLAAGKRKLPLGRKLRAGRYRLKVTATDAAGNVSARKTVRFRVAKKRRR